MPTKFSPPDTSQAIERSRLEKLLDDAEERGIVSVCAPAGTGKSTFIATYVSKRFSRRLWLNLDASDSDPANFFRMFSYGFEAALELDIAFPLFSPEYLQSISVYSTNFFRHIFQADTAETAIVLDNLHNIPEESPVHEIVLSMMRELPESSRLFILSRTSLPFTLLDWPTERRILRLGWAHLRFFPDEIRRLFEVRGFVNLTKDELEMVSRASRGLVANILFQMRRLGGVRVEDLSGAKGLDMLQSEFSSMDPDEIGLLMQVAEFAEISKKEALALTGSKEVLEILERYATDGFFVVAVEGDSTVYRIHDIFRKFLSQQARSLMSDAEYEHHMRKVANLFLQEGKEDEAVRVLDIIGAVGDVYEIIKENGIRWLHEGRLFLLEKCIELLRESRFFKEPWILYFRGCLIRFNEPHQAVELLRAAYSHFVERCDEKGIKTVVGELLDTAQYLGEDFSYVGSLLDEADRMIDGLGDTGTTQIDAMLAAHAGIMHLLHRADPVRSIQCLEKAMEVLENAGTIPILQTYLLVYAAISCDAAGQCKKAEEYFDKAQALFDRCPEHPPFRFMFDFLASIHEVFTGQFEESVKRIEKTVDYARNWGLFMQEEHLHIRSLEGLLFQGRAKEAKKILDVISGLKYRNTFSMAMTYQLRAQMHLIEGDYHDAAVSAEHSANLFNKVQAHVFEDSSMSLHALAIAQMDDTESAVRILEDIISRAWQKGHVMQAFSSLLHLSFVLFVQERTDEAMAALGRAFSLGRRHGFKAAYNWYPDLMSRLLGEALEYDVETEYAKSLIAFHRLSPPRSIPSDTGWPWFLRIYTFGELKVLREDEPIGASQWRGAKSLEFLKAILSMGTEMLSAEVVGDLLWPDVDGDRALQNVEFTLRRLRSTLAGTSSMRNKVLPLKGGMVSLNRDICWVDTYAFRQYVLLSERSEAQGRLEQAYYFRQKAVALYRGPFLDGFNEPWVITAREKWHQKFLHTADALAQFLAKKGKWDDLLRLCRQVLSFDPVSSRFTYLLMKALERSGRTDEALMTYERFERLCVDMKQSCPTDRLANFYEAMKNRGGLR